MKATDTGFSLSTNRTLGMLYPEEKRLYNDPVSEKLVTGLGSKLFVRFLRIPLVLKLTTAFYERTYPGVLGYFFCRFKYYDEVIEDCLNNNEVSTIVNLGAGMDPKAYYISGVENIRYYEVDHPDVIERKKETIRKVMGKLPEHVTYVAVDFNSQDVETELQNAGYELSSKTLFIWESVSAYLTKEANDATFVLVSKARSGSKIAFSYTNDSFITGENLNNKALQRLRQTLVERYKIVVHGYDPNTIESYLSNFGLSVLDHVGAEEFKNRYENLRKLGLDLIEVERMVLAEVN